MINDTKDAYEDTMKKQKAKIKTMIDGVEQQIEELNLDNVDSEDISDDENDQALLMDWTPIENLEYVADKVCPTKVFLIMLLLEWISQC